MNSASSLRLALLALALPAMSIAQDNTTQENTTPVIPDAPVLPWRADASFNYSRGDYGLADDTEVYVAATNLVYDTASWRFQAGVPFLYIKGPATVVGGGAGVGTRPPDSTESGLGDVTLSGTYKFGPLTPAEIETDFTAQVKFPTADEDKGLGTGKTDFYLQFDVRKTYGRFTPFATVGYRILGTSAAYPLEDGLFASLGVATPVTDKTTAGVSVSWREKIVSGGDDSVDAMVFAQQTLTTRWSALVYVLAGFTDASPDFGAGTGVSYKF
ncbi:transporter [Rariglobus hedericola]|nr:transporter [Rariglobus hedericola]